MKFRIVVGEKGNENGHIILSKARTGRGARIALGKALGKYQGDGWGYIETNVEGTLADKWQRLRDSIEF